MNRNDMLDVVKVLNVYKNEVFAETFIVDVPVEQIELVKLSVGSINFNVVMTNTESTLTSSTWSLVLDTILTEPLDVKTYNYDVVVVLKSMTSITVQTGVLVINQIINTPIGGGSSAIEVAKDVASFPQTGVVDALYYSIADDCLFYWSQRTSKYEILNYKQFTNIFNENGQINADLIPLVEKIHIGGLPPEDLTQIWLDTDLEGEDPIATNPAKIQQSEQTVYTFNFNNHTEDFKLPSLGAVNYELPALKSKPDAITHFNTIYSLPQQSDVDYNLPTFGVETKRTLQKQSAVDYNLPNLKVESERCLPPMSKVDYKLPK